MNAFDWLMDYADCLEGDHGLWWQRRAEQHGDEMLKGEKRGKWFEWRNIRQTESPPLAAVADPGEPR